MNEKLSKMKLQVSNPTNVKKIQWTEDLTLKLEHFQNEVSSLESKTPPFLPVGTRTLIVILLTFPVRDIIFNSFKSSEDTIRSKN